MPTGGRAYACVLIGLLWVCTPVALSQSTTQGTILGTVTDPSGGIVPGATVLVRNVDTGIVRESLSSELGTYRVDLLRPGLYEVTVELLGFRRTEMSQVELRVGQTLRVDVRLQIGEVTDSVVVSDSITGLQSESSQLGEVVDSIQIANLPLNGREFLQLAALVPGAESGNPKRGTVLSKGISVGFSGARAQYNSYNIDGAVSTAAESNQLISSPSLDAIKEFRVETNMYSAQYGRSGGAVMSIVTKSGTNDFHGSLFHYHRNKSLDALPYFFNGTRQEHPGYLFNQFGGSLGGPIIRNRTFFFFSGEWFRQKKPGQNRISFAPTAKERVGDLSETINPYTFEPTILINPFTGEEIADKQVPASLINPVGQTLMGLWPEPNFDDPFTNLRFMRSGAFNQDKLLFRVDHNFNEQNILAGTFNYGQYDNTNVGDTIYSDKNAPQHDRTFSLNYTWVISPNLVNDLRFSRTSYLHGDDFLLNDKIYASEWGMWSGSNTEAPGSPRVLLYTVGFNIFQIGGPGPNLFDEKQFYFKDNLIWTKGNHTFVFGADFHRQDFNWLIEFVRGDGAPYFGLFDGDPALSHIYGVSGSTFSSVLMATTARHTFGVGGGQPLELTRDLFGFWFQDDWRIHPRLTLNLGLRYDYLAPFSEKGGQLATLNFDTGMIQYAEGAPADKLATLKFPFATGGPNRPYEPNKRDFAPRIGFAFRPFNDNSTAVRGGYGLFYTVETAFATTYGSWVQPFSGQFEYFFRGFAWPDGMDRFVPLDQQPVQMEDQQGITPGVFQINPPYYPTGYFQQWNLAVERQIAPRLVAEVAYVGSKGTNLNGSTSIFNYSPELAAKVRDFIPSLGPAIRMKGFNSKYHSLQTKLKKDFSHGLNFLASYTWGHAMAEASNDSTLENIATDSTLLATNIRRFYSNADFDVRHRLSLSGGYQLPFGRGKQYGGGWNTVTDGLLGGWQAHWIVTFSGGYPFTVYDPTLRFPNRVCDGNLPSGQRTVERWYDHTCFPSRPAEQITLPDGTMQTVNLNGDSVANVIRGPGINNVDLGIHKNFSFGEEKSVQVRLESFNLLNRPNLIGPTANYFFNNPAGTEITRARESRDIQIALKILF